jgi:uncharacterized protein with von Willebrand factor type A (vWA) domain
MDLAYEVQRWPRVMFRGEVEAGGQLAEAVSARDEGQWGGFVREMFGRLYGVGTRQLEAPREGAEWAAELHRQADAVPEWAALEGRVRGDAWRAGLGAGAASRILAARLPERLPSEDLEGLEAEAEILRKFMEGGGGRRVSQKLLEQRGEIQQRIAAARKDSADALEQLKRQDGVAVRSAVREAAKAAGELLDEMEGGLDGLGCGTGAGVEHRRAMARHMASSDKLRRIAVLAGRLRTQARSKQRTKVNHEREEMHGISKGDDIQRLLASEVGLLVRRETKGLLLARLADKRALQYELKGRQTKTRGPIVFAIDTSGSMGGQREVWSKACALAMMEVARIQRRGFAVLYFNTTVAAEYRFDPSRYDVAQVLECLSYFSGGGTCIAAALARGAELITDKGWRPGKDADVVLITDGDDHSDVESPAKVLADAGATLYTIAIQAQPTAALARASREVVQIGAADMTAASGKLDGVFSM